MVFNKNKIVWKCKLNLSIFLVFFFLSIDAGIILKINSSCGCFELQSSLSDWVKHVFQNKKALHWSPFLSRICCSKFKPNHQTKVSKNSLMFEQKLLEKKKEVVTRTASQHESGNFIVMEDLGGSKHFKQNPFCFLSVFNKFQSLFFERQIQWTF